MRIVFVQPYYFNCWEALGIAYIGSYLKDCSDTLDVVFFQGYFDDDETILNAAKNADILAFSCTSPVYRHALHLATEAKRANPGIRTVFGGFHPSALPAECINSPVVDQVIVGEGEEAFKQIVNGDQSPIIYGRKFDQFSSIFPDRQLIRNERTIDLCEKMTGMRICSFQSVRGCPFQCFFCAEHVITGKFNQTSNPIRERPASHLLGEIEKVTKDYSLDYFKFTDATWNTSKEKVLSFCEETVRRKLTLPWEVNIHASLIDKTMFAAMKKAGCRQVNIGCESGSEPILKDIRKGLKIETIKNAFKWAAEAGIERRAFFIIGMPNETMADIRKTEQLVEAIRPEVFGVTILCPYPGTDAYDHDTMKDYDWTFADEYSNPYWCTDHFSNQDLKKIQSQLTEKFSDSLAWHHKHISAERT